MRSRLRVGCLGFRALLLCCALPASVAAEDGVALRLQADPACVSAEQLRGRIVAPSWHWVEGSEPRPHLALDAEVLGQPGGTWLVRLRVRWPDGPPAERSVAAQSCAASLDALALFVQMTLDAAERPPPRRRADARAPAAVRKKEQGRSAHGREASSVRPRPGANDVPPDAGAALVQPEHLDGPKPRSERAAQATDSAGAGRSNVTTEDGGRRAQGATQPWWSVRDVMAGLSVGVASGAAPELQPGLGVFGGFGLLGAGVVRPWLQIELVHAWVSGIELPAGRADFALDGAQAWLCPISWQSAYAAAHGCGVVELARLRARGYDTYEPRVQTRAWTSAGAGLLVRAPLWRLDLQLALGLVHPMVRDQFSFAPDVFFAIPAWRWQLKVGLGVRFL